MSEELKNSYVCPNCYCSDGWIEYRGSLECKHCHESVPLKNILEYNKENKGWFKLE